MTTGSGATLQSHVTLQELASRPDGQDWIVGRVATGEFVSLPAEAMTFLGVLQDGGTVAEAKRRTELAHGQDVDALDFVDDLVELGFVAAVDGERIKGQQPRPPSLRWLRPEHVSWLFGPPSLLAVAAFIGAGVAVSAVTDSFPGYSAFFAMGEPGLSFVLAAAASMAIIALHEFSHLAAARAAGVHGWFSWGTRMWFLVAQTSVPGLWMATRAVRLRVFIAGMTSDLVVFSGCSIGSAAVPAVGATHRVLGLICLVTLLVIAEQFLFFMRTDVYLVIQELTGCKNLFGDASDYLRYRAGRLTRSSGEGRLNPLNDLPLAERRPVRLYSAFVVAGCAALVPLFALYVVPIDVGIYVRAIRELAWACPHPDLPWLPTGQECSSSRWHSRLCSSAHCSIHTVPICVTCCGLPSGDGKPQAQAEQVPPRSPPLLAL